jgi:hypothetical protein
MIRCNFVDFVVKFINSLWSPLDSFIYMCYLIQRRNLRIVYDAIGTLADAVGAELNQVSTSFDWSPMLVPIISSHVSFQMMHTVESFTSNLT